MANNEEMILKCIEVYVGDYPPEKQYACSIMLRMKLKNKKYKALMRIIKESLGFRINDRNSTEVTRWKKAVKKIGKCEICGSNENLEAHHIIPWEYSIKGRTDVKNGMCLCKECHKMMHNDNEWIDYMRNRRDG